MTTDLDTFETALLAELRSVVEERQAPRRSRRRYLYAGLAAAAAGVAVLVLPGTGAQPAYAVTTDGDGDVHVRVHGLEDAQGLEDALAVQGVAAVVTYLPDSTQCAEGRYAQAPDTEGAFSMSMGAGYGYSIDMDAGVVRDGETLVIDASPVENGALVSVGVASGTVGPCEQVPAALPPGGREG